MMFKADCHIHTSNSHDGKLPLSEVVARAEANGMDYICTTDHLDYDMEYGGCRAPIRWSVLNPAKYRAEWESAERALKAKGSKMQLAFGVEASFCDDALVNEQYLKLTREYPFDLVINSVHCVNGRDAYFSDYFLFKSKKKAYGDYLDTILKSLDAPYPYEVIAHIGYLSHGAPYKDKTLRYADFPDKFDAILKGVIERGKALEINTHHNIVPGEDILARYFELGGRRISYGGDSHRGEVGCRLDEVVALAKRIGFTSYCIFKNHEIIEVPFDEE